MNHHATTLVLGCILAAIACPAKDNNSIQAAEASGDVARAVRSLVEADWVDQDRRFQPGQSLKAVPPTNAGSAPSPVQAAVELPPMPQHVTTAEDAAGGCDGIKNGSGGFTSPAASRIRGGKSTWVRPTCLDRVVVYNRCDSATAHERTATSCRRRRRDPDNREFRSGLRAHGESVFYGFTDNEPLVIDLKGKELRARIVRLAGPRPMFVRLGRDRSLRGRRSAAEHRLEQTGGPDQREPAFRIRARFRISSSRKNTAFA